MDRDGNGSESPKSDVRLLDAWRKHGDRAAMDTLVRRHIHFVYGAARRQVRDSTLAQDVTQAVFMLLMQKSPALRCDAALAVWLHRTTGYACANAKRMKLRQLRREWRASRPELDDPVSDTATARVDAADEQAAMLPILDEAIERLGRDERRGVILCYFQQRTFRQIGATLGITEEAARKRVSRAIDRMRDFFASRGVVAGSSTAVITCLAAESSAAAAPPALLLGTIKLATVAQLAGAGAATAASLPVASAQIMKGVVHTMLIGKLKLATAACAAVIVGGVVTTTTVRHALARQSASPVSTIFNAAASSLTAASSAEQYKIDLPNDITVEFLGVAKVPLETGAWRALDGSKISHAASPYDRHEIGLGEASRAVLIRVTGKHSLSGKVHGGRLTSETILDGGPDEAFWLFGIQPDSARQSIDLELTLADGEWQTLVEARQRPGRGLGMHGTAQGGVAFTHLMETPGGGGGSFVYIAHEKTDQAWQVCALDSNGALHPCVNIDTGEAGKVYTIAARFDVPVEEVTAVVIRTRPYNRTVLARDIAILEEKPTKPQITVQDK
jgi:RNA polymerase sigma factor (sigma-70 family)